MVLRTVPLSPLTQTVFPLALTPRRLAVVPLVTGDPGLRGRRQADWRKEVSTRPLIVVNTRVMDSPPAVPPVAKIVPVSTTLFGDTRTDPYAWLRDRNDPDTIKYLEAENAYTQAMMKSTEELQAKLYAEMLGRIKQTDLSVPVKRDEYFYYTRTEEGKQYAIYCRKKGSLEAPEEILLDGNVLGEGQKYFRVGNFAVSPNHRLLAYSVDFEGDEMYTIRVMDLETRAMLADEIPNTYYSLEWANDNRTFFYTTLDAAKRPHQVYRHTLGEKENPLIYHEEDQRFTLAVEKTSSRNFILINIEQPAHVRSPLCQRRSARMSPSRPFCRACTRSNTISRITVRFVLHPHQRQRQDVSRGARPGRRSVAAELAGFLAQARPRHGGRRARVPRLPGDRGARPRPQPDPDPPFPDRRARILSSSRSRSTRPVWDRMPNSTRTCLALSLHFARYSTLRVRLRHADAPAGTQEAAGSAGRIRSGPISIRARVRQGARTAPKCRFRSCTKKAFERNGSAPLLLYGYGSYGISIDPTFNSDRLSLLDRGMVYAIAHIRGGGDLGKPWHEDGRMLVKMNTFTDFIAAAEYLIARSTRRRIAWRSWAAAPAGC